MCQTNTTDWIPWDIHEWRANGIWICDMLSFVIWIYIANALLNDTHQWKSQKWNETQRVNEPNRMQHENENLKSDSWIIYDRKR